MHSGRSVFLVDGGEGVGEGAVVEAASLNGAGGGCPMAAAATAAAATAAVAAAPAEEPKFSPLRFGRLFSAMPGFPPAPGDAAATELWRKMETAFVALGRCMNDPEGCHGGPAGGGAQQESEIPAGYTYLGQFITHEITLDKTEGLPLVELKPENGRSPSLDLDSLYGTGLKDDEREKLYDKERPARLKLGPTQAPLPVTFGAGGAPVAVFDVTFENDLPREDRDGKKSVAVVGDRRNDENLPLAQTHVAFIKFHNRVVADLERGDYKGAGLQPGQDLFKTAQDEVVKHFHWIILKDYLPKIVGDKVLAPLIRKPDRFKPAGKEDLFIPLEFSAAAFRIGHSMVRRRYKWNRRHKDVALSELFTHTSRSGNLDGLERLDSTWVIDWKRFYDFTPFAADYPPPYDLPHDYNRAGLIDTVFDLHLNNIKTFDHGGLPDDRRAITVRNLLRGLAVGLPWGETVAAALGEEPPQGLRDVPHPERVNAEAFGGKTPLWFYVLRESRLKGEGGGLGPVGGRIVADTLVGLIRHSDHTILRKVAGAGDEWEFSDWRPAYGRPAPAPERVKFEMPDLLRAADVVDPLGKRVYDAAHS